ncbi:MAG TPA: hypothetical protein VL967_07175 [Terracidiphilus sp.]|nr:hypothetical protein [Terracidiphilus sp.]
MHSKHPAFVTGAKLAQSAFITLLMVSWLSLSGCGSSGNKSTNQGGGTTAPTVSGVSPSSIAASNSAQTLTINGSGFVSGATVTYHDPTGAAHTGDAITFVSASQITDPAFNDGNLAGSWTVTVINPGNLSSSAFSFTVTAAPAPVISSVSPSSPTAMSGAQTLTINGSNFQSGATTTYTDPSGATHAGDATTFVSASQITNPSFNDLNLAGKWTVTVINPGSVNSNTFSFTVVASVPPPAPSITSVSPTTPLALSSAQTLTINGSNFQSGATATYKDPSGTTHTGDAITFVSSSQIVDSAFNDGSLAGTWTVTVINPGSVSSNSFSFTVVVPAPAISGVSPSSPTAENNPQTLTINGSNFQTGATATYKDPSGNAYTGHATTFVSASQLIDYGFDDFNTAGTWTVTVTNPGSVNSNTFSFTVTTSVPAPAITSISPTNPAASSSAQTLTINGSNFQSGATATYKDPSGNTHAGNATNFVSANQITDTGFNDQNMPGTWTVTVINPGTGNTTSNSYSFSVPASAPTTTFTMVQHTTSSCTSSPCADAITSTTAGNLLVLWSAAQYSGTGSALAENFVAASGDSAWTHCPNQVVNYIDGLGTVNSLDCWYILSAAGGATSVTATWNFAGLSSPAYAIADELVELHPSSTPIYYDTGNATDTVASCSTCTGPAGLLSGSDAVLQATILSSLPTGISSPYSTPDILSGTNSAFSVGLNQTSYAQPTWTGTTSDYPSFYSMAAFGGNPNPVKTLDYLIDFSACTAGSAPTVSCLTNSTFSGTFSDTPTLAQAGPNLTITNSGPTSQLPVTPTIFNGAQITGTSPVNLSCTTSGTGTSCGSVQTGVEMTPQSITIGYTVESDCPATGVDCGAVGGIFSKDAELDFAAVHFSPLGNGKICFETKAGPGCASQTTLAYTPNTAYRVNMQVNNYAGATTDYITVCADGPGGAVLGTWTAQATTANAVDDQLVLGISGEEPAVAGYTYTWRNVDLSLSGQFSTTSCF